MAIFNSLGSNYDFSYIKKSLTTFGNSKDLDELAQFLEKKYDGKVFLFYKGREVLSCALRILNLPHDSKVAINGFTCVAVFNAIRYAGLEPICLDLEKTGGLNFTAETLEEEIKKNKKIKAVVIQNTLGYPCEIKKIEAICNKNDLILIEDLAHCIGTKYEDGREAGTVGDFVVLSFSQDKIIDAVSGGALVIRNKKYEMQNMFMDEQKSKSSAKDRLYPLLTYKIRKLYSVKIGKPYHYFLKKIGLMSKIMDESFYDFYNLPAWNANMSMYGFSNLTKQLFHRKKIAKIYTESLPDKIFMFDAKKMLESVELSANLRFPIFVENRANLLAKLRKQDIFLYDIWYFDVDPNSKNAIANSKIILNLPTHINISENDARKICGIINSWIQK